MVQGIWDRDTRVSEIVARELQKTKPGKWGYVQVCEIWSPNEETHVCPGHNWLLKFVKVFGSMTCVEKEFILVPRKYEEYKGRCCYNGDYVLMIVNSGDYFHVCRITC